MLWLESPPYQARGTVCSRAAGTSYSRERFPVVRGQAWAGGQRKPGDARFSEGGPTLAMRELAAEEDALLPLSLETGEDTVGFGLAAARPCSRDLVHSRKYTSSIQMSIARGGPESGVVFFWPCQLMPYTCAGSQRACW